MNNAETFPVDIEQEREWLVAEKEARAAAGQPNSWTVLAKLSGIPAGTLSTFGGGTYGGDNARVAREVFKFRQLVASQSDRTIGMVENPGYFDTPTSSRLRALLIIAQMGRITVGATGPGTGKTMTMAEYRSSVANVWVATMRQTKKTVNAMTIEVLRALGITGKPAWGASLSDMVVQQVAGKRGLLVIDEANHLTWEALEEIRGWHDATGVGVCLLGNEELLMRIQGGQRKDAFARLNSRIAQSHIQTMPVAGDVDAFCDAWGLQDSGMRALLTKIALSPGAGGLRECRQIVEQASMLAADENRPLALGDLRDAQGGRATRHIGG